MIEAIETKCNHWVVRATDPITGKEWQTLPGTSEADAVRLAHFMFRRYIIEKMTSWLRMRMMAYRATGFEQQAQSAYTLLGQVIYLSQASPGSIRKFLRDREKQIIALAPPERSQHYPYYEKVIGSVIAFCRETEENHA